MDSLIAVGQPAPDFELLDLNGTSYRLSDWLDQVVVINFWSAECPWAERGDQEILSYIRQWEQAVNLWSIASNANEQPDLLASVSTERGLPVLLHDAQQQVADLYAARTTPHLYVIDRDGMLRYQGALNDTTFRRRKPTRFYLREAVDAVLAGHEPDLTQTDPYGCAIVRHAP